jgi:tRNA(fMet)-specific endonuclease VapC
MHLLDCDTLTHLHYGNEKVARRLDQCEDDDIGIAIVTKAEILRGRYDAVLKAADGEQLLRAQNLLHRTEELLATMILVLLDDRAAREFDRLRRRRALRKIGHADLLLASMVLANQATLVTRNLRHFRQVPNLNLEDWAD